MKATCPRCGGAELLNNLDLIQSDLYYSRGRLRSTPIYPLGGFPSLACDICKGQGWIDDTAYPGGLFRLHLDASGFWVLLPNVSSPVFEGHFAKDSTGFAVIDTVLNQGLFATVASSFIVLY